MEREFMILNRVCVNSNAYADFLSSQNENVCDCIVDCKVAIGFGEEYQNTVIATLEDIESLVQDGWILQGTTNPIRGKYSSKEISSMAAVDEIKKQLIKNVEDSRND